MTTISVQSDDFNSVVISKISVDGKTAYLASDLGRALGYAKGKLARNIRMRWTTEFMHGVDFDQLRGEQIDRLRGLIPRLFRTRRPMVLFESGVEKLLARTPFEIANPLSVFLRREAPAVAPAPAVTWSLDTAASFDAAWRERDHFHGACLCALTAMRMGLTDVAKAALEEALAQRQVGGAS